MKSRFLAIPFLILSLSTAAPADPLAPVTTVGNAAEKRFSALVSDYLRGYFAFEPGWATSSGLHQFDTRLEDRSRGAIDGEIARTKRVLAEVKKIDARNLSDSARVDYDLFSRSVEGRLFDLTEMQRWET